MTDLSVIILTKNKQLHIQRCMESSGKTGLTCFPSLSSMNGPSLYAKREAQMAVSDKMNPNKRAYYRLPPYFRAFAYFCIRYFLKLGFLDGVPGWKWHFYQGLWYRLLVDREIGKMKKSVVH